VGHPNLWDNLKTLRKHPNFKPLRMALAAWLIFSITFGSLGIYSLQHAVRILAASPVADTFTDETKIATSTQITVDTVAGQVKLSAIPWACGDTLTDSRDSETYATVLIGSQCWMAEYINVGTLLAGASNQTDNAVIEKYCYSDTEGNCTTDGGLYQWDEAMQYTASCNGTGAPPNDACATPVQGICPADWHIPSHYEYVTLERAVCTSASCATDFPYDVSATGWRGTDEGTKLKVGGSSGFEGLLAGYRNTDGSFLNRGTYAYIWSSLESGTNAWSRYLYSGYASVYRYAYDKLYGFSARCIKD
ncbi:MAG: FISUMP domain-containing protein, partial [Pseudorhodobacter sp.]|nr:FISUMP domain-containing protein [Pseudorhodobacter sp.]